MIRFKRIMALTLVFLLLITGIDLTVFKEENTADASSNITYALVVGYFEYWKDSSGNYMYDDKNGVRHVMGKGDPNSYSVSNYTYPVATIGTTHKIKNIYSLPYYGGSWADLNYTALDETEVREYYLDSAVVSNASHLIGTSQTQVMFTTSFYPRSTDTSKKITSNKWRNYIAMVIEYEPANSAEVTINYLDESTGQKIKTSDKNPLKLNAYNSFPIPSVKGYEYQYYQYNKGSDNKGLSIYFYADANAKEHVIDVYYEQVGEVDPPPPQDNDVNAVLELDVPDYITTNYMDFKRGYFTYGPKVKADGSNSTADLEIDSYSFEVKVGTQTKTNSSSNPIFEERYDIDADGVDIFNGIPVNARLEVEDVDGNIDIDTQSTYIPIKFFNSWPDANFTYPSGMLYASIPFTLKDGSYDPEYDMNYRQYTIKNSKGNVVLQGQVYEREEDKAYNYMNTNPNIVEATIVGNDLQLNFKEKDYYTIEQHVWDMGAPELNVDAEDDIYTQKIFVNSVPAPPIADFTLPEFGFPSSPVSIVDKSTDPNDDIVKWEWTKPAQATGTLENSGGVVTFANKGEYSVSLKVTDATNFSDTATKKIKIIDPMPIANITDTGNSKRNRKVNVSMKDSLNPSIDPIQVARNVWTITPLDGQSLDHINIDVLASAITKKATSKEIKGFDNLDLQFNDIGRYKVGIQIHNNFSDKNPTHASKGATYTEKIITITEDEIPQGEFELKGSNPNFKDNPLKTTADVKATAFSIDADLIDSYKYTIIRDNNENGDFTDDPVYGTYTTPNALINVYFQQGNSGKFKAILELKEQFGQPTIEKFANKGTLTENVTDKGRRTAVIEKVFDINWIPDISFNLPQFAYTDDTLNLATTLKDEEIDTLDVVWTLKRAREGNTSILDDVDLNSFTDNVLDNNGGQIRFKESGYYELTGTVTDEIGQTSFFKDTIRIYPLPTAVIKDEMSFRGQEFVSKENRKYKLNGNESYAQDYYGAELHTIDHSRDYWEIIPLDGQDAISNIKVAQGAGELKSDTANPSKYSKFDNHFDEELLFKLKGRYKVRYQVTNAYGKKSPFAEQIITVAEDTKPIISFNTLDKTYRNPDDSNLATIAGHSISATSDDDDIIDIQRIRYRFDSNNDGSFDDETWSSEVAIDSTDKKASVKVAHVGKYQFEFYVKERFGQETIDQFVTDADRRTDTKFKGIEVDNMAPNVDFAITPSNKVDIVFTVGQIDKNKVQELNTKINTYVKAYLESNNADLVDTNIKMVETSSISTSDGDAKKIFDTWASFPQVNSWGYDETTKTVYNNDNPPWETGFYDPTKFESKDFDMETMVYSNQPNQPIGLMFKMHPSPTYADRYNMYYWWASGTHAILFKVENAKINEPRNKWNNTYSATPLLSFNNKAEYYRNGSLKTENQNDTSLASLIEVEDNARDGNYGKDGGGNSYASGYWNSGLQRFFGNERLIDFGKIINHETTEEITVKGVHHNYGPYRVYISEDNVNWEKIIDENVPNKYMLNIHKNTIKINKNFRYIKLEVGGDNRAVRGLEVWINYKNYENFLGWPNPPELVDYGGFPHMTPLQKGIKVSNLADPLMKTTILNYVPVNHTKNWHKLSVSMQGNKIISSFDSNTIETIDASAYEKGTMGFFQYSHEGSKFKDIKVTTGEIKTLDEALRSISWRDDATKFLVNLSDIKLPELEPTSSKYAPILSRFLSDGLYFAELGTATNKTQADNFIKANDSKGTFIYNNQPNMDKALENLGIWILDTVRNQKKPASKYILLDDLVNYDIFYKDYENDPKMEDVNKWKYAHDSLYYQNSLGQVSYHNQWLDESKNSFNKVGKFTVEYKTRDNPVGTDDRFDNYRKWSSMLNGPLDIFVHRKPIATFKANIVKSPTTFTISYTDNSYDLDHQTRVAGKYKLDINNNIIFDPGGHEVQPKGIVQRQWQWREVGATTWNDGQLNTGSTTKEYLVRLRVKDMDGAVGALTGTNYNLSGNAIATPITFDGVWSEWETVLITANPQPPIAQFILSHTILPIDSTLGITDTSYDPNGDTIDGWRWKLYKEGALVGGTLTSQNSQTSINNLIKANGIGNYTLTLQVKDNSGGWDNPLSTSDIYSQDFKVIPLNRAPIVDFNPDFTWNPQRAITVYDKFVPDNIAGKRWNSTYSDPDTDNLGFVLDWTADRYVDSTGYSKSLDVIDTGELEVSKKYSGDIPFTNSFEDNNLKYGAYKVTFSVTDKPPLPPFGLPKLEPMTTKVTKNIYVLPRLELEPSYSPNGPAVNTKAITLKAKTNEHVTKVEVTFLGKKVLLTQVGKIGSDKYWETDFTIPANNTLFGNQTALFRAYCNYGNMGDLYFIDKSLDIQVNSLLEIKGWQKGRENLGYGEANVGETITLIAESSESAVSVDVGLLGDNLNMIQIPSSEVSNYYKNPLPDKKYWRVNYTIPDTITDDTQATAVFTARDSYGQVAKYNYEIKIMALQLIYFRIQDIVNHPHYTFPMGRDKLPADYKAGYKVTFRIDSIGNPVSVKARLYENNSFAKEVNMNPIGANTWEGTYYSSADLPLGTPIKINLKGYKGATVYDYNYKSIPKWDDGGTLGSDMTGIILRTNGTALQDGIINRTN